MCTKISLKSDRSTNASYQPGAADSYHSAPESACVAQCLGIVVHLSPAKSRAGGAEPGRHSSHRSRQALRGLSFGSSAESPYGNTESISVYQRHLDAPLFGHALFTVAVTQVGLPKFQNITSNDFNAQAHFELSAVYELLNYL